MEKLPIITLLLLLSCLLVFDSVCSNAHVVNCLASDRDALLDFKTGLQDPEKLLSSWKGTNCCQWYGIQCDNTTGAVVAIDLHNPYPSWLYSPNRYGLWNLSGELRPSLVKLKSLRHLDLSFNTFNGIPIPKFIGSIENLQYLNLSNTGFSGTIPLNLGNLSRLEVLDLDCRYSGRLDVENLQWVTGLVSLKYLSMGGVNLSLVKDWVGPLNHLPFIVELHLSFCDISGHIPSLTSLNFTSLVVIDFSGNNFKSMIPYWLVNISILQYIDMSYNDLQGRIPLGLGELPNLLFLDLSYNKNLTATCSQLFKGRWEKIQELHLYDNGLHGELPSSLGNMTSLMYLDLSFNYIAGEIPSFIGKLYNLTYFFLSGNNLSGSLPEFLEGTKSYHPSRNPLPNLLILDLRYNNLVGKIPIWLGQLENMVELYLGNNHLQGIVSEAHFSNLTKLKTVDLSFNPFNVSFSSNWIPPFQVQNLWMGSCILGPSFPSWLKSQKEVENLDFSNASISGSIPSWFWNISNMNVVDMSHNELQGQLPNSLHVPFPRILILSFNQLEGPINIPRKMVENYLLDLSHNQFSGLVPQSIGENMLNLEFLSLSNNHLYGEIPMSIGLMSFLKVIDLSSNNFTGRIPSSLANCSGLIAIDVGNNSLSGAIPNSLGQLQSLRTLHLSNNQLSGNVLSTFVNLSNLETMDLANNRFLGEIPAWFGDGFPYLTILNLRSNAFSGEIPFELSKLSSLQVLDLGDNDLSGSIPASLGDLKAMAEDQKLTRYQFFRGGYDYYEESLVVETKGQLLKYTNTLSLVTSMDLSRNNLSGRFPQEITKLSSLVNLNLSGNHITGNIPRSISNLHQLSSLDLSSNKLSGTIPSSLSSLSFLGYLNLSNNNLTGSIPYIGHTTTFDAPSFVGNPGLCGRPLPLSSRCPDDEDHGHGFDKGASIEEKYDDGGFIDNWFYLSLGLGFAVGILEPFCILAMKRSWSDAYFDLVDTIVYELLVLARGRKSHVHRNKPHHRQ